MKWVFEAPLYTGDERARGAYIQATDAAGKLVHWITLGAYLSDDQQASAREMVRLLNEAQEMRAPVPELEGSFPIVLYFGSQADADQFTRIAQAAQPGLTARQL